MRGCWLMMVVLAGCLTASVVEAQEVERGSLSGHGIALRRYRNAAEKQGRIDWPDPRSGAPGTQARLTFDPNNADLTLVTGIEYGVPRLLEEAQHLAAALDLPATDFITLEGRSTAGVDLEFNDYLRRGRFRRDFDFDLRRLKEALERTPLPRPIVLSIDPGDASRVLLAGEGSERLVSDTTFLGLSEVPRRAKLHFEATVTAVGLAVGTMAAGVMVALLIGPLLLILRRDRMPGAEPEPATTTPAAPEEVQKRYDRSPPAWLFPLGFVVAPVLVFSGGAGLFKQASTTWTILLPVPQSWIIFGITGTTLVASALGAARRRRKSTQAVKCPEETSKVPGASPHFFGAAMIVVMVCLMGMTGLLMWPVYTPEGLLLRRYLAIGLAAAVPVLMVVLAIRGMRAGRETLRDGPWYELVHELAGMAGVRVKHVVLLKSPALNAYASIWGTIGLTAGLVEKLEPEEVRAVVAHELGHLKLGHPRWVFVVSLGCTLSLLALTWALDAALGDRLLASIRMMLRGPMFVIFLLPLLRMALMGRGMRLREHQADRLAAEWVGNPELVIRAIERMHVLSETPGRLKPSDEALASHPSLVHRIRALRAIAPSTPET